MQRLKSLGGPSTSTFSGRTLQLPFSVLLAVAISLSSGHVSIVTTCQTMASAVLACVLVYPVSEECFDLQASLFLIPKTQTLTDT